VSGPDGRAGGTTTATTTTTATDGDDCAAHLLNEKHVVALGPFGEQRVAQEEHHGLDDGRQGPGECHRRGGHEWDLPDDDVVVVDLEEGEGGSVRRNIEH